MAQATQITIKRPNGDIEVITRDEVIRPFVQKQMIEATRKAGRGEILGFEIIGDVAAPSLESQRCTLVASVRGAIDEQAYQFERAHAREDVLAWNIKAKHEPAIAAARAALAEFDAAHPEIIAAIRAEKQEAAERFLRQD